MTTSKVRALESKLDMIDRDLEKLKDLRKKTIAEILTIKAESVVDCPIAIGEVIKTWNGIDVIVKSIEKGVTCKWLAKCSRIDGRGIFCVSSHNYAASQVDRDTYDISDYLSTVELLNRKGKGVPYRKVTTYWKDTFGDDMDSVERYRVSERVAKHRNAVFAAHGRLFYPYPSDEEIVAIAESIGDSKD